MTAVKAHVLLAGISKCLLIFLPHSCMHKMHHMFAGYISILSWQEANYLIHVHGNMQAKRNFFITFLSLVLVYLPVLKEFLIIRKTKHL